MNCGTYGASVRVALEAAVAATSRATRRAGVRREVALSARPDAARSPVVGNAEGDGSACSHLPASCLRGNGAAGVEVCEETRPADISAAEWGWVSKSKTHQTV